MTLRIFNTRSGQKEAFEPVTPGKVRMYVCGVTTYDVCHLGHARAAVAFDVIVRHLRQSYAVTFVRNVTDVDDKIIHRAHELGVPWDQHARTYTERMHQDFAKLGILPPDIEPKATENIPQMIQIIEQLIVKGLAYASDGDVFFAVRAFKNYGDLSKKTLDDLLSGARVAIDEKKKDPLDFALWKAAKPDEPSWESPWGKGRPGWHIECSAMSHRYLGETLDIHGGGRDLIFPHHENEIAQSEGSSGKPFVKYWLHNGFVTVDKEKMSKSTGNFFSIEHVLFHHPAEAVRLFLLSSHYRGPIDYSTEHLQEAKGRLDRVYQFKARLKRVSGTVAVPADVEKEVEGLPVRVQEAMDDDFNTAAALAAIFEMIRKVNTFCDQHAAAGDGNRTLSQKALAQLAKVTQSLGVFESEPEAWLQQLPAAQAADGLNESQIQALIQQRNDARKEKNFKRADEIRQELLAKNILLEDTAQGTVWRAKT